MQTRREMLRSIEPWDSGAGRSNSNYRYSKKRWRILFGAIDQVCTPLFRVFQNRELSNSAEPQAILVVQLDHIGDAVLTTPLIRAMALRFPQAAIDVLASRANREVFLTNRRVRRVHVSERNWHERDPRRRSWLPEVLHQARQMRRFHYDLAIDPRGDFLVNMLLWLAGIPRRVGWRCGGGAFLLTHVAPWRNNSHELDNRRTLGATLGIDRPDFFDAPELTPAWTDHYHVREVLAAHSTLKHPLIVVHPAAGTPAKRWPIKHWSTLIDQILIRTEASIILVGDANDRGRVRSLPSDRTRIVDLTGRLTLMQLAALFHEADLFVGCDSGPAHVAAAMMVPCVVLFSGTNDVDCWRPVGDHVTTVRQSVPCSPCHLRRCSVPGHPCMTNISPHCVFQSIADSLLHLNGRSVVTPQWMAQSVSAEPDSPLER